MRPYAWLRCARLAVSRTILIMAAGTVGHVSRGSDRQGARRARLEVVWMGTPPGWKGRSSPRPAIHGDGGDDGRAGKGKLAWFLLR